jgi:hypothetical protein
MEWVIGVVCILVLLARRRSRKTKLEDAKRRLDPLVLKGAAQSWMTNFYNQPPARGLISDLRSQIALPDILAFLHSKGFEGGFKISLLPKFKKLGRADAWAGVDERGFYDSIAKEFLGDTFGSEVAETAMDRVENSSLAPPPNDLLTRRWVGISEVQAILVEIHLDALRTSRSNLKDLISNRRAEEWLAQLHGHKTPVRTPEELSLWDELVFCARSREFYLKTERESFGLSLRNAAIDYELPLEHFVEGSELDWFEQTFFAAVVKLLNHESFTHVDFGEAVESVRQNP